MSEFWDKVNAGYVAAGGEAHPEVWSDYRPPRQAKPKVQKKPARRYAPRVDGPSDRGPERLVSHDQARKILAEYEAGDSCPVLAERHHVSTGTIRLSILRCGGEMRTKKQAAVLARKAELTDEVKAEMAAFYRSGRGLYATRNHFSIGVLRLREILEEQGVVLRPDGTPRKRGSEQEQEIRRVYETGLSIRATGIQFGIPTTSTRESILRAGGTIRNSKFANRNKRTGSISE